MDESNSRVVQVPLEPATTTWLGGGVIGQDELIRSLAISMQMLANLAGLVVWLDQLQPLAPDRETERGATAGGERPRGMPRAREESRQALAGAVKVRSHHRQSSHPGHRDAMPSRFASRYAELAWRQVLDEEREHRALDLASRGGSSSEQGRPPLDAPTIRALTPTRDRSERRQPLLADALQIVFEVVAQQGVVDEPFAPRKARPPLVLLGAVWLAEGDQLEIGTILKRDERIMRGAAEVLTAGRHGKTSLSVVVDRLAELPNDNDQVIDVP